MLDELRQKPKKVREHYAFFGALGITAVIALVWVSATASKFGMFSEATLVEQDQSPTTTEGAFAQSFSDVSDNVANAWQAFTQNSRESLATNTAATTTAEQNPPLNSSNTPAFTFSQSSTSSGVITPEINTRRPILIATTSKKVASSTE